MFANLEFSVISSCDWATQRTLNLKKKKNVCSFVCLFGFYVPLEKKVMKSRFISYEYFTKGLLAVYWFYLLKYNLCKFRHTCQTLSAKIQLWLIWFLNTGSMIETFCHRCRLCYYFWLFPVLWFFKKMFELTFIGSIKITKNVSCFIHSNDYSRFSYLLPANHQITKLKKIMF